MLQKLIIVGVLFVGTTLADEPPKPGTFYKYGELGVKKTVINGSKIHLTFKPKDEQFHWCPGIKVQVTDKATVVTFVRCKTSKNANIDTKAKIGKNMIRSVTIDTKNQDTYVRNGEKKFRKIFSGSKKAKATNPAVKKKKGKKRATSANARRRNDEQQHSRTSSMRPTPEEFRPSPTDAKKQFIINNDFFRPLGV